MGFNTKNLDFFNGMLLHSSVAMETCFGPWGYILKTAIARHSNVIPFDSQ